MKRFLILSLVAFSLILAGCNIMSSSGSNRNEDHRFPGLQVVTPELLKSPTRISLSNEDIKGALSQQKIAGVEIANVKEDANLYYNPLPSAVSGKGGTLQFDKQQVINLLDCDTTSSDKIKPPLEKALKIKIGAPYLADAKQTFSIPDNAYLEVQPLLVYRVFYFSVTKEQKVSQCKLAVAKEIIMTKRNLQSLPENGAESK